MMTNERRKTIVVKAKKELKGTFFRLLRIHINIYIYICIKGVRRNPVKKPCENIHGYIQS